MKHKLFVAILFIAIGTTANAQISLRTDYFGSSKYIDDDTEETMGKGSAISYSGDLNIPLYTKIHDNNQATMWAINAGATYVNLTNKKFTEDRALNQILNLYMGLSFTAPISKKWSIMASAGAGVYSPYSQFSKITKDHILGNVGLLFVCNIRPNFQVGGGVAVNNSFGYPMAFPALYIHWFTDGNIDVDISVMDGFQGKVMYNFNKHIAAGLCMDVTGEMALLEKEGKKMMFSHQYLVAGILTEFRLSEKINIPVTLGMNGLRMTEYSDRTLKAMFSSSGPSGYFDISPYISVGLQIGF